MVRNVVCPREQWQAKASAGKYFLTLLIEWEFKVAAYEASSSDRISEAVRDATVLGHTLEPLKTTLCQTPLDQRCTVASLKMWTREASSVLRGLFHGQEPMQVSAIGGDAKGNKTKVKQTKGIGKGKVRGKGHDGGNNKDRDNS